MQLFSSFWLFLLTTSLSDTLPSSKTISWLYLPTTRINTRSQDTARSLVTTPKPREARPRASVGDTPRGSSHTRAPTAAPLPALPAGGSRAEPSPSRPYRAAGSPPPRSAAPAPAPPFPSRAGGAQHEAGRLSPPRGGAVGCPWFRPPRP